MRKFRSNGGCSQRKNRWIFACWTCRCWIHGGKKICWAHSLPIWSCRCFPSWLRMSGRTSAAGRPKALRRPNSVVCALAVRSNPCRTTFWKTATFGSQATSPAWRPPEDAGCHQAPFTGKPGTFGKAASILSNKVYFLGKSAFFLLGKKIVPVKPRWATNFPFAPLSLKVQFLGNRRGGILVSSPGSWKKPLRSALILPRLLQSCLFASGGVARPTLILWYVQYCFAQCLSCVLLAGKNGFSRTAL